MEDISVEYFPNSVVPGSNGKNQNFIHIKLMTINKMRIIHMLICFIY